jgi:hypothetical protein
VTPAFCVLSWTDCDYGDYSNYIWEIHKDASKDMYTGLWGFYTQEYDFWTDSWTRTTDVFQIPGLNRQSYHCSPGYGYDYNHVADFRIAVWATGVKPSGLFPPAPSYPCVLKSWATAIRENCNPPPVGLDCDDRMPFNLPGTGWATVAMHWVNYNYAYPMQSWVGGLFDDL